MLKGIFSLTTLLSVLILSIAGTAAYFSIYGLMLIFSGAPIAVAIMAGTLETGKLVFTSVLFNYWKRLNKLLTGYGIIAIFFLMLITSGGIYGFLSAAYQTSQVPLSQLNVQIEALDQQAKRGQDRIQELDRIIASIGANYVSKRIEEKKQQSGERNRLQKQIDEVYKKKLELSSGKLETEVHIGPIIKIAEAFNLPTDKAVHYLILLFIFVFDPLAVALTLCLNAIIAIKKQDESSQVTIAPTAIIPPVGDNNVETDEQTYNTEDTTQFANSEPSAVVVTEHTPPIQEPVVPKYDDSELIKRLDTLAREMKEVKNNSIPVSPPSKNDLRQSLINNTRNGDIE